VLKDVKAAKLTLDNKDASEDALMEALRTLHSLGTLPTKILSDTLIGKSVNNVAKTSSIAAVKDSALKLVSAWKENHRKRKASFSLDRTLSQDSRGSGLEGSPSFNALRSVLSQETLEVTAVPEQPEDKNKMTEKREKIVKKIVEALGHVESLEVKEGSNDDGVGMADPQTLAADIETALHSHLSEKEYINQARALLFNLKDKKNPTFRFKLLVGAIRPEQVPKLSAAEMASDQKIAERKKLRDEAMAEIDQDWAMKNGQIRISGLFTCGKCKGTQTTYFQMQTRSSDEPMTTFASCLSCGNRWKFC
jgi:transcription elongation factor S-II